MFCPNCGGHQSGGKKFCTACGQNLTLVSQALTGRSAGVQEPVRSGSLEHDRQRDLAKGVKLTIIGGAFLALQFFTFIFSLPFRNSGSSFGFLSFIALVLMAVGVSKLVSARPVTVRDPSQYRPVSPTGFPSAPTPRVLEEPRLEVNAPATSSLDDARQPGPSVTEEETQHLPESRRSAT
jgi:hypothetical protein